MYLVINKCVTAVTVSYFSGYYLRNRSTLDMGVLGYIGIVQHKEHSPEVLSIPPGTPCIYIYIYIYIYIAPLPPDSEHHIKWVRLCSYAYVARRTLFTIKPVPDEVRIQFGFIQIRDYTKEKYQIKVSRHLLVCNSNTSFQ